MMSCTRIYVESTGTRRFELILLSSNEIDLDYLRDYIFTGPDLVPSEVTRAWNQDPPLDLAEPELIY